MNPGTMRKGTLIFILAASSGTASIAHFSRSVKRYSELFFLAFFGLRLSFVHGSTCHGAARIPSALAE